MSPRRPCYIQKIQALTCLVCLLLATTGAHAVTPVHLWSQGAGGTGLDVANSVAVDASGNVLMAGSFQGMLNFGGSNLTSVASDDVFVVKYNAHGEHQWSVGFGGDSPGADRGYSVAADGSGNVFVAGLLTDFDLLATHVLFTKFNAAGVVQWSKIFTGGGIFEQARSIAADGAGNVFVTGSFGGTINFGGGNLVGAGLNDVFLTKFDAGGVHQWSQRFGGIFNDIAYSVTVDASNNALVTGSFQGTANFGGVNLVSAGSTEIFVAKYSALGAHQWSQRFGGTGIDQANSIAIDPSGNVFVTGWFQNTVNFGGGNLVSAGSNDVFVAKYNAGGAHQWSQRFGAANADQGNGVAIDASGNVRLTGSFQNTVSFGGTGLVSAGGNDVFVARYDAAGGHLRSQRFGSTSEDAGNSVAPDASGNDITAGHFTDTVNFGGGDLVSAGNRDIFVMKYANTPAEPLISTISDIGNDQGRKVKIRFTRSGLDQAQAAPAIDEYVAFRRDDPAPAASSANTLADGWTEVGRVRAFEEPSYGIDVPTIGDSTVALGQYFSVFRIRAATATPGTFFDSPSDSGYSLDNLAPGAPLNLAYASGQLSWDESEADDFDYFTVYGANTESFGSAIVVDFSVTPTMDVGASPYVFYFATATDFSGNESPPAKVNTLSNAGGAPASYVLSISSYPNPFNPATTIRYTVPARSAVTVAIFDARGRKVATLVSSTDHAAGAHSTTWDGRDGNGTRVASGVYMARIEAAGDLRSRKMVLLK